MPVLLARFLDNSIWGKFNKMSNKFASKRSMDNYMKNNEGFVDMPENDWLIVCQKMLIFMVLCSPCRQKDAEVCVY